ncbi:MAG: OpgC domain-containing protein [Edaphobacter sp.]|uniref:OpgC family protein n=1 Tax=Edaphobacter sp. TaxID=1934404 RepID=UPI0023830939|nr:OpgC domain-containing protein [Edaphobacter sp.]MDE1178348.1 OpgC domain-containing protein [Edaphobacter sp.]
MTNAFEQRSISVLHLGRSRRRPELDALRGLFLIWMTLTHLPTHLSDFVNQPFGYISSAEGFVFLSGLLVAHLYVRVAEDDEDKMKAKLWKRSLRIYGYHLLMLLFAFTIVAAVAAHTHRPALVNLLNFYLAHPGTAIVGSLLLIYCPPLLDILPMYVTFMLVTPSLLLIAKRWTWKPILAVSGLIWLLAQFGLRAWVHNIVVAVTGLHIPLQETGAFNLFAWQIVWIAGLWVGATSAHGEIPFRSLPRVAYPICAAVCAFFIAVRHNWLGWMNQQYFGLQLDKWQIGPLRLINLFAFACVLYWSRRLVSRIVLVEPLLTLGKASLEVFCAHVFFVFGGLALLYGEIDQLHGIHAVALVIFTFTGMLLVALREVRRAKQQKQMTIETPAPSTSG